MFCSRQKSWTSSIWWRFNSSWKEWKSLNYIIALLTLEVVKQTGVFDCHSCAQMSCANKSLTSSSLSFSNDFFPEQQTNTVFSRCVSNARSSRAACTSFSSEILTPTTAWLSAAHPGRTKRLTCIQNTIMLNKFATIASTTLPMRRSVHQPRGRPVDSCGFVLRPHRFGRWCRCGGGCYRADPVWGAPRSCSQGVHNAARCDAILPVLCDPCCLHCPSSSTCHVACRKRALQIKTTTITIAQCTTNNDRMYHLRH